MHKRTIILHTGQELEVSLTTEFINLIKEHYRIEDNAKITDDHIRYFIYNSVKSAADNAEEE